MVSVLRPAERGRSCHGKRESFESQIKVLITIDDTAHIFLSEEDWANGVDRNGMRHIRKAEFPAAGDQTMSNKACSYPLQAKMREHLIALGS